MIGDGTNSAILDWTRQQTRLVQQSPSDSDKDIEVWVGGGKPLQGPFAGEMQGRPRPTGPRETQKASVMQEAVLAMDASRNPAYDSLANLLVAGRFLKEEYVDFPSYTASSLGIAIQSHAAYVKEGGELPLMEWLQWYGSTKRREEQVAGPGRPGAYMGPVTTTTTAITDEVTAEALLSQFSRDLLGRSLTEEETAKYLRQFREAEEASPQISTTTPRGMAFRDVESVTAADKGELLRQILVQNPDYQRYQIDTTIMDMLLEDIEEGKKVIYGGFPGR